MGCAGSKQTDQVTIDPKKEEPAAPPRLSAHNLGESWVDETPNPALQFDLDNDGDKEVVHGLKFQTAKPKPAEEPVKKEASVKKEPEKKEPEKREPEKKPSLVKQLSNALSPRASKMKREEEEEQAAKLEAEKLEAERQRLAAAEAKAAKEAQERVEAAAAKVVAAEIAEEAIDHGIKLYEAEANKPGVLTKTMKSVGRSLRNLFKPEDEKEEPEPDVPPPPPRKPSTHEPPPRIAAKIAFKHMDKNGDGELSRSEVIDACRKDPEIRSMLNLPTIHVDQFEGYAAVTHSGDPPVARFFHSKTMLYTPASLRVALHACVAPRCSSLCVAPRCSSRLRRSASSCVAPRRPAPPCAALRRPAAHPLALRVPLAPAERVECSRRCSRPWIATTTIRLMRASSSSGS